MTISRTTGADSVFPLLVREEAGGAWLLFFFFSLLEEDRKTNTMPSASAIVFEGCSAENVLTALSIVLGLYCY